MRQKCRTHERTLVLTEDKKINMQRVVLIILKSSNPELEASGGKTELKERQKCPSPKIPERNGFFQKLWTDTPRIKESFAGSKYQVYMDLLEKFQRRPQKPHTL